MSPLALGNRGQGSQVKSMAFGVVLGEPLQRRPCQRQEEKAPGPRIGVEATPSPARMATGAARNERRDEERGRSRGIRTGTDHPGGPSGLALLGSAPPRLYR